MQFNAEDQQLLEELRSKYAGLAKTQDSSTADESRYATASTLTKYTGSGNGKQSDVEVKLCQHCKGSGVLVEEYNHRRLERSCNSCEGKGVNVYRNGVEVLDAALPSSQPKPEWAQDPSERRQQLESELAGLDQRLASYQQERDQASSSCTGKDPEGDKLRQDLTAQLDSQISRLSKARAAKHRTLQGLSGGQQAMVGQGA